MQALLAVVLGVLTLATELSAQTATSYLSGSPNAPHSSQSLSKDGPLVPDQFNNPILETLADSMMFRDVNLSTGAVTYYLAGTSFSRFKSKDMVHWQRLSNWSDVNQAQRWPGSNNQSISGVWACEVIKRASTYYLYFSAVKPDGIRRVVYVATSSSIEGVFTIQPTPVVELSDRNAIDPHPFCDPVSGMYYLYYSQDQATDPQNIARIYVIQLSENMLTMSSGTTASLCVEAETQSWESQWQEGAAVCEHNGYYYLFYSSRCYCNDSYSVGYATSVSPSGGTWTKYAGNPILKKTNSALGKISGPGHINLVKAPDGVEDWMVYHAHIATAAGGQRHTCLDRYRFQPNPGGGPDIVVLDGPTLAKQTLPAGAAALPAVAPVETFDNITTLTRDRWSKVRQEDSADYQLTGSQLLIEPKAGALFTDGVDAIAKNVLLQYAPTAGDWFADTALTFSGIPTNRQSDVFGGLVTWQDSRHYVALLADAGGRLLTETCNQTFNNHEVVTTNLLGTPVLNPRFLRLSYDEAARQYAFQASSNGVTYTQVATLNSTLADERFVYVGLAAYSQAQASNVSGAEARFDWFHLNQSATLRYVRPWTGEDVGGPALAGATFATGASEFTVVGSGADIGGTADKFHFAHRELIGNGEIIAQVLGLENTHSSAKAGVMMRESVASGSANVLAGLTPSKKVFQLRPGSGATTATWSSSQTPPRWVKLVRAGNVFTPYDSADGNNWIQFGPAQMIGLSSNILVGLAVTSHDDSKLCSAQFANVQVRQYYHWPLDTNTLDVLGGLSSTVVGKAQFVSDHIVGTGSLRLDGNTLILLDDNAALENETFAYTISFWFKPAKLEGVQVIFEEGGAANGIAVQLNGSALQAGISADSVLASVSLPGVHSNVWQYATVTYDGTEGNPGRLALYCNGQSAENSTAPASIPAHSNNSAFGGVNSNYAFSGGGGQFDGLLDDFRITEGIALPPDLADQDSDGLSDAQELAIATDPSKWDTDGDGVSDGFEVVFAGTNPLLPEDTFKIAYSAESRAFAIPSVSAFDFVFEQWNPPSSQWTHRAGPYATKGSQTMITLDQLGYTPVEGAVLLRVRVIP